MKIRLIKKKQNDEKKIDKNTTVNDGNEVNENISMIHNQLKNIIIENHLTKENFLKIVCDYFNETQNLEKKELINVDNNINDSNINNISKTNTKQNVSNNNPNLKNNIEFFNRQNILRFDENELLDRYYFYGYCKNESFENYKRKLKILDFIKDPGAFDIDPEKRETWLDETKMKNANADVASEIYLIFNNFKNYYDFINFMIIIENEE